MVKFYCDKCGREVSDNRLFAISIDGEPGYGFNMIYNGMPYNHPPIRKFEFCGECAAEAVEMLMKKRHG